MKRQKYVLIEGHRKITFDLSDLHVHGLENTKKLLWHQNWINCCSIDYSSGHFLTSGSKMHQFKHWTCAFVFFSHVGAVTGKQLWWRAWWKIMWENLRWNG